MTIEPRANYGKSVNELRTNAGKFARGARVNHEGYYDPTAYVAIERARQRRKCKVLGSGRLTYRIGEVKGFQRARKAIA